MQPNALDITSTGDLGGEKIDMKFDENSIAHIMSLLTDLYSDPELAVIREYSTNARDSHIEAGQTRPVEISLPNALSRFFKVKDYGIGLSVEDVTEIYSKYGASTKRDSNAYNGMLGIGGKSALTYTQQFNVIAVKNGVRVCVSVSRKTDGTGVMEIVDTSTTDEPNGVEVIVTVKDYNSFNRKANRFYRFWEPGVVLVNGQEPNYFEGDQITPNILLVDDLDKDYVVQGNVGYPLEDRLYHGYGYNYNSWGLVMQVPVGDVDFTPSREALHYTAHTKATVARLKKEFNDAILAKIERDIEDAPSAPEAVRRMVSWKQKFSRLGHKQYRYKGVVIPVSIQYPDQSMMYFPGRYRNSIGSGRNFDTNMDKTIFVKDFPSREKITSNQKKKLEKWAYDNGHHSVARYIFSDRFPEMWFEELPEVSWDDVKKVKLERTVAAPRDPAKYDVLQATGAYHYESSLDTTKPIYYFKKSDEFRGYEKDLHALFPNATLVQLAANRVNKFKRDYPTAEHVMDHVKATLAAAEKALTEEDKWVLTIDAYRVEDYRTLDYEKIEDPEVSAFIKALSSGKDSATLKAYQAATVLATKWHVSLKDRRDEQNPLSKYSLLSGMNVFTMRNHKEHVYTYMNAHYRAETGKTDGN